jgi:hypothetical protein
MSKVTPLPQALAQPSNPLIAALLLLPPQPPPPAQRLIVLVPDQPIHEASFARQLFELAHPHQANLLLLSLVTDERRALRARRRLATLAALARDVRNHVETSLITGTWLDAVRAVWEPGDLVVCHLEQTLTTWDQPLPLAEALITRLHIPIYLLSGFYPDQKISTTPHWMRAILADLAAAGILIGFSLFQVELLQVTPQWLSTLLLCLSVIGEFALIALWHRYTFRDSDHD